MLLSSLFEMLIEYVTVCPFTACGTLRLRFTRDRKSTRLNSSHITISYAVFCLKKKKRPHERFELLGMLVVHSFGGGSQVLVSHEIDNLRVVLASQGKELIGLHLFGLVVRRYMA